MELLSVYIYTSVHLETDAYKFLTCSPSNVTSVVIFNSFLINDLLKFASIAHNLSYQRDNYQFIKARPNKYAKRDLSDLSS